MSLRAILLQHHVVAALLCAVAVVAAVVSADEERTRYDHYHLYDVTPSTDEHLQLLDELWRTSDSHVFLQTSRHLGAEWLLVVAPHKLAEFHATLNAAGVAHRRRLDDLQSVIDEEAHQTARSTDFSWTAYHTLDRIYEWLDQLAIDHSAHVTPISLGNTYENRPIRGIKISIGDAATDTATATGRKPGVFIEGGIHAREWISPAFVTYLANELLTSRNASVRWAAESHDWYIVPTVNPDGYAYTHTGDRLWRKTRQPHGRWCRGADPNRNWDFHWNEHSTSPFPCSDIYPGPVPFSEPEARNYADYLRELGDRISTFVAFHSYSQLLLYPYGHTTEPAPNQADLQAIGEAAAQALERRHGTRYRVGSIYDTIYPASGASTDWVYGVLNVSLAYTYELRPGDGWRGFELPAEQIVPVGEETVDSLVALLRRAQELKYNGRIETKASKPCGVVRLFH